MSTIFDALPPDIRHVLARRELARRGLSDTPPATSEGDLSRLTRDERVQVHAILGKLPAPVDGRWDLTTLTDAELEFLLEVRTRIDAVAAG